MVRRFTIALCLAGTCLAQDVARMDHVVQSFVSNKQFSGSVLVARGGDILFNKGYGSANFEWDVANTPSTKFRLASITKQFTAASILFLQQGGKLSVDDLVKKYLPDEPAAWDKITIFNLLTHTSGIPDFTDFPEYASLEPFATTPAKLVERFRDRPLEFEPGEKWKYSNSGYVLLGYLIEKLSGKSYEAFVQKNIFAPLGMKDSGYDSNSAIIPRRASGYEPGPHGPVNAGYIHMSIPFAAGALYSTTEDLLRWEQGLFGGKLLFPASLQTMITPFKGEYAFGLQVHAENGRKVIDHGGSIQGFNTVLAYYPDTKLTVVALANLNGPALGTIATLLAALAHGEKIQLPTFRKEISVSRQTLLGRVGTYPFAPGVNMLIMLEDGQLMAKFGSQPSVPIFPESENIFFYKVADAQIEFASSDRGKSAYLVLHQNGRHLKAQRTSVDIQSSQLPPDRHEKTVALETLAEYVGTYALVPGFRISITLEGNKLMTQAAGQAKFSLFAESETKFFLKLGDAQVEFVKDEKGTVTHFILRQGGQDQKALRQ